MESRPGISGFAECSESSVPSISPALMHVQPPPSVHEQHSKTKDVNIGTSSNGSSPRSGKRQTLPRTNTGLSVASSWTMKSGGTGLSRPFETVTIAKRRLAKSKTVNTFLSFATNNASADADKLSTTEQEANALLAHMTRPRLSSPNRLSGEAELQEAAGDRSEAMSKMMKRGVWLSKEIVQRVVVEDEFQCVSCTSLPFTVIFFMSFTLLFQRHYSTDQLFVAETPLRIRLEEPALEVTDLLGVYDYFSEHALPYLWSLDGRAEGSQRHAQGQELVGGVLLRMASSVEYQCEDDLARHVLCHHEDEVDDGLWFSRGTRRMDTKETAAWVSSVGGAATRGHELRSRGKVATAHKSGPPHRKTRRRKRSGPRWLRHARLLAPPMSVRRLPRVSGSGPARAVSSPKVARTEDPRRRLAVGARPDLRPHLPMPVHTLPAAEMLLRLDSTLEEVRREVAVMRENQLLHRSTLFFGLTALVKNENFASGLASYVDVDFIFSRGGEIYVHTQISTLILRTTPLTSFTAAVWLLILFGYSISPILQACGAWRNRRLGSHLSRFWNVFDWFLSIYGGVVAMLFIADRLWSNNMGEMLLNFDNSSDGAESSLREILTVASRVAWYSMWLQVLVVYYQLVVLIRYFKASRGQARLATVVTTIQKGMVDIFHLLIVFGLIMSSYVCSGHILFGSRMKEFGTFRAALSECIAMIFKREYEWARFSEEDKFTAMMWCWSFLVVNALTLVNLFLAMIFDNYAEIRLMSKDGDTLWKTAFKLCEQIMYLGSWVPNQEVLAAVHGMHGDSQVTRRSMRMALPRIPEAQLSRMFGAATRRFEATLLHGNQNLEVEALASILLSLEEVMAQTQVARGDADEAPDATPSGSKRSDADELTSQSFAPDPCSEDASDYLRGPPARAPRWLDQRLAPHLERHVEDLETIPWHLDTVKRQLRRYGIMPKQERRSPSPRRRTAHESEDAWCEDMDLSPPILPRNRSRGQLSSLSKASTGLESGMTLTKFSYGPPPSHLSNFPSGPLARSPGKPVLEASSTSTLPSTNSTALSPAPNPHTAPLQPTTLFRTEVRRTPGRTVASKASDQPLFDEPEELVPTS